MTKFWQGVLQTVIAAALMALLAKTWQTYETILELRFDVDSLYSKVDDVAKRIP